MQNLGKFAYGEEDICNLLDKYFSFIFKLDRNSSDYLHTI